MNIIAHAQIQHIPVSNGTKKDCYVIYDGKPKHRYVQQAAPARHGPSENILFNQFIILIIYIH